VLQAASLRQTVAALVPVLPWVVFGAGVLLAWRFNRSALALALLVLFAAERALAAFAAGAGAAAGTGRVVATAAALLVPLNLAALAWVSERSIRSPAGRWILGALLAEPLAVALLCRPELAHLARALEHGVVETSAVALAIVLARFLVRRTIIHSSLAWAVVAALLAVRSGGAAATVYLATGGLVLVVSLVETSHRMAYGDELTGLPGRRALDEALLRLGGRYAIAMVDIDHFKRFNDQYGHDAGDQLLRMVGGQLTQIEAGGRPFRYGGEEFAVLFPGKSADASVSCPSRPHSSPTVPWKISAMDSRKPMKRRSGRQRKRPWRMSSSKNCPRVTTVFWERKACDSRAVSSSASPSRGPYSRTHRSCCWTKPPVPWMRKVKSWSRRPWNI